MNYKLNDSKVFDFNSIRFKAWLYIFTLTVSILAILLVVQISFFASYYATMKRNDVKLLGQTVSERYRAVSRDNAEFERYVYSSIYTSGSNIILFTVQWRTDEHGVEVIDKIVNLFTTDDYAEVNEGVMPTPAIGADFFIKAEHENEFEYMSKDGEASYIVYGAKVFDPQDGTVYIHVSSPLSQSRFMTSVLRRQSIISTILCAVLSLALSVLLSKRIARPVSQFSKTARKLASGDFSVRFSGEGFSEIEDLAFTLNYATEEMGKTDQLRRDLLANVSHDLRTPLTMVKAYAEMIRDLSGKDPQKRVSHCQTIIDEADRLTNLVNDIQNLSKLQSGTDAVETDCVDLSALTRSVMERFNIYAEKYGYVFITDIDYGCKVLADEKKLEQVLYNLIGNAINYTGDDNTVTVFVKNKDNTVYFEVCDTGKGISPAEIDTVWERYYRAEQSKRKRVGTGLGLSIVKNILVLHNAEHGIKSTVGEGSCFWFTLPVFGQTAPPDITEEKVKHKKKH